MADLLPECLIHKILCFLSFKEATKTSILSKTWLQAWLTLPNLKFTVDYRNGNMKIVDDIMERYRDGKIPIEKFNLSDSVFCSEDFPLIDKWLGIALQNGVKDLVVGVCSFPLYPLPIFKILAAKSLREFVLSDSNLMHVSLSSGVTNCHSLRKLSLINVHLDGNMLQTLLHSCPLIVTFILKYCSGPKQLVKIQIPTLEHLSYNGLWEELDVGDCQSLKSLDLSYVRISDGFLQNLISRSQSLKVLKIQYCRGVPIEIDSSNLVSLEYMGYQIPELKTAKESSQLKHSKIVLNCCDNLNAAWFCKLRKFLSNSASWSQISLYFSGRKINMKDLQLDHRGSTPKVDVLNVNIQLVNKECPKFVDALLWSCHPRKLNLQSTVRINKCFINRLMYMKNSSRSTSHGSKPRYSQLKEIKAFDDKNQPLELKSGKLAVGTLMEGEKVYFLFDW